MQTSSVFIILLILVSGTLNAQRSTSQDANFREDMMILKKFFKKSERKGLYRHLKKLKQSDKKTVLALHEKYEISTAYMEQSEELLSKSKTTWKERRNDKKETSFRLRELRSFLVKNQVIKYVPRKGARLDGTGARFQI